MEYIPPDLKSNVTLCRIFGMWPPFKKSHLYSLLSIIVLVIIGVGFPLSQLINIPLLSSVDKIMDQFLISCTAIAGTFKGINIYLQQMKIRELFQLHKKMLANHAKDHKERSKFLEIAKDNVTILKLFICMYLCGGTGVTLQTIFSSRENKLYLSTYLLPYEFAKSALVYYPVNVYQVLCTFCLCVWNAIADTYPIIMILMLCGHLDNLQAQLENLGIRREKYLNHKDYVELRNCVLYYQACLSFSRVLEEVVSAAFLFQFGTSGFVICLSVYQLSIMNLSYISKLVFVTIYLLCMIAQILIPSYFGSLLIDKSMKTTQAIYFSKWMNYDEKWKKSYIIFVERTLRAISILAGGLFILSLPTFLTILRSAYSLFALLKRVSE